MERYIAQMGQREINKKKNTYKNIFSKGNRKTLKEKIKICM